MNKIENQKKALLKFILNDNDFKKIKDNKSVMVDFINSEYENGLISYLDKRYIDISYVVIDDSIIDLDSLYFDFKDYVTQ